jgi:4-amino-4-deoxy-L-arabinose transferase-like glycosyltransferase
MRATAKILRFPGEEVRHIPARWWNRWPITVGLIFSALLMTHWPLLPLPYFWDEVGYYIPAAYDLFTKHQLVPTSTLSNAHPPLTMVWLWAWWKLFGYHATVTRIAMLAISTFTLAGVFRLARIVANDEVAIGATIGTALFPVFFAQSTLAHLDMAAAGFTIWGLCEYVKGRHWATASWFSLAALSKETAVLAPGALLLWEALGLLTKKPYFQYRASRRSTSWLLVPFVPLAIWFAYHYHVTGLLYGNPEYLQYNLGATLHPVRVVAALAQRCWQLLGYMNLFVLSLVTALAMSRSPRELPTLSSGNGSGHPLRPRISVPMQMTFAVVILTYVLSLSVVGGAVLARYLLPVYPLVIIVFVSTLWRRLPMWQAFLAVACFAFVLALVINPPYHFSPEDNLDYADFVQLHQQLARFLENHPPQGRVLTAWPASDELTKPYLGYVPKPFQVVRIEDFSAAQIMAARDQEELFGTALLFSTKYEPSGGFLIRLPFWRELQKRYFDYHVDMPPEAAAEMLGGDIVWEQRRGGQWAAVVEMKRAVNARMRVPGRH